MRRDAAWASALVVLLAGCGSSAAPGESGMPSDTIALATPPAVGGQLSAFPTASDRAEPSGTQRPSTAAGTTSLRVEGFAEVVANQVLVRSLPDRDSEPTIDASLCIDLPGAICPPLAVGRDTRFTSVYLIDGPVSADGYEWYLAAIESDGALYWESIGWIAAGDSEDPWLMPAERACPQPPYELADVAFPPLLPLSALYCLGGEELTLRGFYPGPPPEEPGPQECVSEPAWLVCTFGWHFLRVAESGFAGSLPAITLHLHPDVTEMPPRPGWIEVTGLFDHPAASQCGTGDVRTTLGCRVQFVVTSARPISEP